MIDPDQISFDICLGYPIWFDSKKIVSGKVLIPFLDADQEEFELVHRHGFLQSEVTLLSLFVIQNRTGSQLS